MLHRWLIRICQCISLVFFVVVSLAQSVNGLSVDCCGRLLSETAAQRELGKRDQLVVPTKVLSRVLPVLLGCLCGNLGEARAATGWRMVFERVNASNAGRASQGDMSADS